MAVAEKQQSKEISMLPNAKLTSSVFAALTCASPAVAQGPFIEITGTVCADGTGGTARAWLRAVFDTSEPPTPSGGVLMWDAVEYELMIDENADGTCGPVGTVGTPDVSYQPGDSVESSYARLLYSLGTNESVGVLAHVSVNELSSASVTVGLEDGISPAFNSAMTSLPHDPIDYGLSGTDEWFLEGGVTVFSNGVVTSIANAQMAAFGGGTTWTIFDGTVSMSARLVDGPEPTGCNDADFDKNGVLNIDDIDAFVAEFVGGCP